MKKVSIIVPVYNVEKYLERCLYSLVLQTLDDIEIIVVNDGSPDDSQTIIDRFAAEYPDKIKAIEIPNGGVANARNLALDAAEGEYIGFVDSDDYTDPQMFAKMYARAVEEDADLVVAGYTRMYGASSKDFQLGDMELYGKALVEEPKLLVDGVPYIWNKIFRRSMIEAHHLRFEHFSIFEDLLFTYTGFVYANKISKCDAPLYYYRTRREGAVTKNFSRKFFDIFEVTDHLVDVYRKAGCYEQMKEYLLCVYLHHSILRLEELTDRKDVALKLEYNKKLWEYAQKNFPDYKQHKIYFENYGGDPQNYLSESYWAKRVRMSPYLPTKKRLAQSDKVRHIWNLTKTAVGKVKSGGLVKRLLKPSNAIGCEYMHYAKTLPIDEKAILLDSQHGDDINGNMFYLLRYMYGNPQYSSYRIYVPVTEKRRQEFADKLAFYGMPDVNLPLYESAEYLKLLATAKYLFSDTSFMPYFIKRDGQIYLNTWHGTPFKTLGRSSRDEMNRIGNLQKNFRVADYILYPSEFMKGHMLEDYMLDNVAQNHILMSGYPRNVIFFEKENKRIREREQMEGKQVLAYLPTWRGSLNNKTGKDDMKNYLEEFDRKLRDDQICYVNLHPYMKGSISFEGFKHLKLMPQTYETYDFLNSCDVLITDYSSVFFDFACTRKKIVLFAYDEEEYFRDRGVYFPFSELPFTKVNTVDGLIRVIDQPMDYDDTAFLQRFCPYDGPNVAKHICDQLILGQEAGLRIEPMRDNGKKNVLVYTGKFANGLTQDELINTLCRLTEKGDANYYLSFKGNEVAENKCVLRAIPDQIHYIGLLGQPSVAGTDQQLLYRLTRNASVYGKNKEKLLPLLEEELKRNYQNTGIDEIIIYNCIDLVMVSALAQSPAYKKMYIPFMRKAYTRISPEINERFDHIFAGDDSVESKIKANIHGARLTIKKITEEECVNE